MVKWVAGEEPLEKGGRRKENDNQFVPSPCSSGLRLCLWRRHRISGWGALRGLHLLPASSLLAVLTPMLPQRRIAYAQGYLALGMVAEAAAELGQLPAGDAQRPEALAVRLAILHEQEKWNEVRDLARELVSHTPGEPALWVSWAYATRRAESLYAAEQILLNAERHHPTEATIQFNLGCYACQRGDLPTARTRVDRAIALDAKFAQLAATDPDLAPLRAAGTTDCQPSA